MDQSSYFEKWFDNFRWPQVELNGEDKVSALEFFQQHQDQVSKWCRNRNIFSSTVDHRMSPNMLPYSSFLWQWCAQKLREADKDLEKRHYESMLKNIRLPKGRVQNDIVECWCSILRHQYIEFQFQ